MHSSSAEILVRAPREAVWQHITQPELVRKYFFGTVLATDWRPGSPITFRGEWEGRPYEDRGTVLAFEAPQRLSFDYWSSFSGVEDIPERRQIIRYELIETGPDADSGVRVTIDTSNVATQEAADHSAKNWQAVLEGLKAQVESAHG